MTESGRVFDAFRNCITEPKCRDCPWTECDTLKNRVVEIPIDLALAVMRMLKAQEPVKPESIMYTAAGIGISSCPRCGDKIDAYHNAAYCGSCGQAVKWE